METALPHNCKVFLVGAGPGDAGLLSRRGAELLGRAEVVIYDGLVNPELLRLAPTGAEIIYGGKHDRRRCTAQNELNTLLLAKARDGRRVVRLKGGDPYVFARGGEEAEMLADAGIPFEVVPGISSVEAVTNYAGIPLTHRHCCSSYTVVTGHDDPAGPNNRVDWPSLARFPGTLVVLMGLKNLRAIAAILQTHGRQPETPVAVIAWGTTARQKAVVGTLADIAEQVATAKLEPPALTVIGEVVRLREKLNWFEKRPLFGQTVVLTQSLEQARPIADTLRENGAAVLEIPATRFRAPRDGAPLAQALANLQHYDWIIFSNPRGVDLFFQAFFKTHKGLRALGKARLGTYGPVTAEAVRRWRLEPVAVPPDHKPPLILAALQPHGALAGSRVLLLRAEQAMADLPDALKAQGASVDDVPCYTTEPETADASGEAARLRETGADWLVFASGLDVNHFHARFDLPGLLRQFPRMKVVITSPAIRWALEKIGLREAAIAPAAGAAGITACLRQTVAGPACQEP